MDLASKSDRVAQFLQELHPKVLDWFGFYERKLLNQAIPCSFGFRMRKSRLTEQSNLDDYPRAVIVHDRGEVHLDLQSQMIDFALTLQQYAVVLEGPDSPVAKEFEAKATCYAIKLNDLLLNEQMGRYADYVGL